MTKATSGKKDTPKIRGKNREWFKEQVRLLGKEIEKLPPARRQLLNDILDHGDQKKAF